MLHLHTAAATCLPFRHRTQGDSQGLRLQVQVALEFQRLCFGCCRSKTVQGVVHKKPSQSPFTAVAGCSRQAGKPCPSSCRLRTAGLASRQLLLLSGAMPG